MSKALLVGGAVAVVAASTAFAAPAKNPVERYIVDKKDVQVGATSAECKRVVLPNRMRPPFKRDAACGSEPSFVKRSESKPETALSR